MTVIEKNIHWHLIRSKLKKCLCFVSIVNLLPIRAFGKFPMLRSFCNRIRQKQFFLNKPCCIEDKPPVHVCQVQLAGESDEERPSWNSVPLEWLAHLGVRYFAVYLYLFILCVFGISSHSNGLTTSVSIVLLIHLSPNTFKVVSTRFTK